jgi:digeranylgeranylglycerophospholipid reductase
MKKINCDVVVVGAGPGGSMAAKTCAKFGLDTVLVERKDKVANNINFSAVVNQRVIDYIKIDKKFATNEIKGLTFSSPDGTELKLYEPITVNYAIDRRIFDNELAKIAVKENAELMTKTRATGLIKENGQVKGIRAKIDEREDVEVRSNIVIGADGIASNIGRWSGLLDHWKLEDLDIGAEAIIKTTKVLDQNNVHYHLGSAAFGEIRVTPLKEDYYCITCELFSNLADKAPIVYLRSYLKKNGYLSKVIKVSGIGFPLKLLSPCTTDRVMLVGDAAAQGNTTYGGGILHAMDAGVLAGEAAVETHEEEDFSYNLLSRYEKRWYRLHGERDSIERLALRGALSVVWQDKYLNRFVHVLNDTGGLFNKRFIEKFNTPELMRKCIDVLRKQHLDAKQWMAAASKARKFDYSVWDTFIQ